MCRGILISSLTFDSNLDCNIKVKWVIALSNDKYQQSRLGRMLILLGHVVWKRSGSSRPTSASRETEKSWSGWLAAPWNKNREKKGRRQYGRRSSSMWQSRGRLDLRSKKLRLSRQSRPGTVNPSRCVRACRLARGRFVCATELFNFYPFQFLLLQLLSKLESLVFGSRRRDTRRILGENWIKLASFYGARDGKRLGRDGWDILHRMF